MDESMIWNLHGARYDLSPFLDSHPGGKSILMATRGLRDATPLFESYHAFANREYIRGKLEQYRVMGPGMCPLYTYDGLYARIVQRAREHFGAKSDGVSVTNTVKANKWWWFKVLSEVLLMAIMWIVTFFIPVDNTPQMRLLTGFLTGCIFISLGFNTMHDASHFAIGARNHWTNQLFLRAWTAWALWSGCLWMTHHVIRHHSFTGHPELDPDTMHARPFIRKSTESPRSKYIRLPKFVTKLWQMAIIASSVFAFLPGMYVGQILSYSLLWPSKGHLWKMPYPIKGAFDRTYWEQALALSSLLSHFLVSPSWHASAGYFVGCNVAYAICILPDHDTFEAAVENHKELRHEAIHQPLGDWGEIQVRHSSDFGIGFWGRAFGELAGGINFQILHHCLPGVSHVHFPELTKVVEESCIEFNVPFVRHPSLGSALWSVTKTFVLTMAPIQKSKHLDQESAPETSPANHIGVSKKRERSRGLDGVTGLLFGAWLTLCALVIAQHGRHLLVVPLSLTIGLAFHYFKGSFDAKMVDEKFRETRLRRYSNMLSTSRMLSAICATFLVISQQIEWLSREGLTEMATMVVMGVIAAELFALVIGATFALCVSRVVADTVRLALFSALVLRRNQPIALTLLSVDHALSLYSLPILVVPRIALQTVAVSALAAPLITAPLAYGSTALLALTTLVS